MASKKSESKKSEKQVDKTEKALAAEKEQFVKLQVRLNFLQTNFIQHYFNAVLTDFEVSIFVGSILFIKSSILTVTLQFYNLSFFMCIILRSFGNTLMFLILYD